MSPLDDELRAALRGRAADVAPSPDPLRGIEQRARRIRRNRLAASVAGSARAVAASAAVVPALQGSGASAPPPPGIASAAPTEVVTTSSYALDPDKPWAVRGMPVDEGTRAAIQGEYATRTGAAEVLVTPLFAQVYEPSAQLEVVFLARVDAGYRWGVAVVAGAEPTFRWDVELPSPAYALAAALPGGEAGRLLVVAAPEVSRTEYAPDAAGEFSPMASLAPGVAVGALDGDSRTDAYRVIGFEGQELIRTEAPDGEPATDPTSEPANLLTDWPTRGTAVDPDLEQRVLELFSKGLGKPGVRAQYRSLFNSDTDAGVRYTIGQAWNEGGDAHTVVLSLGGTQGEDFLLGPKTDPDAQVVAALLCCQPGSTVDSLIVIPVPGTRQVLYAPTPDGAPQPVGAGQDYLDGVVDIDRELDAQGDRLRLLDGEGDALFDGNVFNLLCGLKGCG